MIFPAIAQNPLRTRADLQQLAADFWAPLEPVFRVGGARTVLGDQRAGYGERAEAMEGFARALWGLAAWRAGGGGGAVDWPLLRAILREGTGPDGWGTMGDYDQRIVETPAVALALVLARDKLWDPLDCHDRAQIVAWLGTINRVRVVENNWLWFRVLTNAALRALGQPHDAAQENADLSLLDTMWHGARGYSDGPDEHRDYYSPMAMHFYGLIYARLTGASTRASGLRERAAAFAPDFLAAFASDGAAIPQGRSLQYRFAQGAFWAALAFAGDCPLPWGVIKGVVLRHLRWWVRRPIFTDSGRLTVGYGYPQPHLAEGYGSSAGPYWAQKTLLVLALPEDHPFWAAEELPPPALPASHVVPAWDWVVTRPRDGSDSVALAASRSDRTWIRHNPAKYHKFAYSAEFAFSIPSGTGSVTQLAPDSMLALSDDDRHWRVREVSETVEIAGDRLRARWRPWPDVIIDTVLWPTGDGGHCREHHIVTDRALWTVEGGFCTPDDTDKPADPTVTMGSARTTAGPFHSEIVDSSGYREGRVLRTEPGTHLLWPLARLPVLSVRLDPGQHRLGCRVRAWRVTGE